LCDAQANAFAATSDNYYFVPEKFFSVHDVPQYKAEVICPVKTGLRLF
jgi:hypothetical protein